MSTIDPLAIAAQRRAADPALSVWVAASAGAGKTKVLTDRLLRLLLAGTPPQRLLCLTFTKAGAAEMANRLAETLADWSIHDDAALGKALTALLGALPDGEGARQALFDFARSLFARVLDSPGGLAIQTIHAFCQSLLARFPLEAGVSPGLVVLDDMAQAALVRRARDLVLTEAVPERNPALAAALAIVSTSAREETFDTLVMTLLGERSRLDRLFERGLNNVQARLESCLGVAPGSDPAAMCREAWLAAPARTLLQQTAAALEAAGKVTDLKHAALLRAALEAPETAAWAAYCRVFLTEKGEPRKTLCTAGVKKAAPDLAQLLQDEQLRVQALCADIDAARTARRTLALLTVVDAIRYTYAELKTQAGRLDYDDMIVKARDLLTRQAGAAWVLFKLDGGLDHVLVDEAQDTNPEQWDIVRAITGEFFVGGEELENPRTIFVVGDEKQSIFSFQRADPDAFRENRTYFEQTVQQGGQRFAKVDLTWSFRSGPAVLAGVDAVFARPEAKGGVMAAGEVMTHRPIHATQAGLVEWWPLAPAPEKIDPDSWRKLEPQAAAATASGGLAKVIAGQIADWLAKGERRANGALLQPADIMVLVRRRGEFLPQLVTELKSLHVPVAGVDRLVLTAQIAVKDLIAFGRFLLLPDDDLNLATLLRSPLVGLDEQTLFDVAWERPRSLWDALQKRSDLPALARLQRWRRRAEGRPPYEIFADLLGAEGGRRALLERLGPEAEEPLDELLDRARAFENEAVPSLEGFLHWLETFATQVKRDNDPRQRNEVRVMTVHASKGLQAPVVFLPDTSQFPVDRQRLLWVPGDDLPLWRTEASHDEITENRKALVKNRAEQEYRRLLYVAMTRAAERLYVTGWAAGSSSAGRGENSWHALVEHGLIGSATSFDFDFSGWLGRPWRGQGLRLVAGQATTTARPADPVASTVAALPAWSQCRPAAEPVPPRPLIPSAAPELPAGQSPVGPAAAQRYRRGNLIHRLLQTLPDLAAERRAELALRYLTAPAQGVTADIARALLGEVTAILDDPAFGPLFGPGSRAEVPLAGIVGRGGDQQVVAGQVDRLLVTAETVFVVDYKTNRPPPRDLDHVAPSYWQQMGAYVALLQQIYPGRAVRAGLLWTDGPRLMELPAARLAAYLPHLG